MRILIADDSEAMRRTLKQLLHSEAESWIVCGEASDGRDTLQKANDLGADVILLDLSITNQSGVEVARALRIERPNTAVVLMSAQEPDVLRRIADTVPVPYSIAKSLLHEELTPLLESIRRSRRSSLKAGI